MNGINVYCFTICTDILFGNTIVRGHYTNTMESEKKYKGRGNE